MPVKKSELYSSLWESCDELRGGMDASQYKDYVLVLLFVKYVSDKYAGQKDALLDVPVGGRFADMVALKGDKEIGDKINKIIGKLAEANDLKGVIDVADFNNDDKLGKGKEMVDRLSNLVSIFDNPALDFRGNRAEGDDILGDAYEYLMRHFATESGKSKGQFYTPAEVSRRHGESRWYRQSQEPGSNRLRPNVRIRLIAAQGCPRSPVWRHYLRAGNGQRYRRVGQDEHDPARQPHGGNLAGQRPLQPPLQTGGRKSQNLRLRCRQSAVLRSKLGPMASTQPKTNSSDSSMAFRPGKNGDYAFLLHILKSLNSNGKGGGESTARRALPGQLPRPKSAGKSSAGGTSRASSVSRPTSSTAPVSRPASSCWTRKTPPAAKASS